MTDREDPTEMDTTNHLQQANFLHRPLRHAQIPLPVLRSLLDGNDVETLLTPAHLLYQVKMFIQDDELPSTPAEKLEVSGTVVSRVVESFYQYCESVFEDLDSISSQAGPLMQLSDFDRYIRQYMELDFDRWIDDSILIAYPVSFTDDNDSIESDGSFSSIVQAVDKAILLEVLEQESEPDEVQIQLELPLTKQLSDLAVDSQSSPLAVTHGEEIGIWATALRQRLSYPVEQLSLFEAPQTSPSNSVAGLIALNLQQLAQETQLSLSQLWLGLLLGDLGHYHLCGRTAATPDPFYHPVVYLAPSGQR
jgi:hypothetical protein